VEEAEVREAGEVRSGGIGGERLVFLPLLWRRGPEPSTRRLQAWLVGSWVFPRLSPIP
jgi:hypothetical protein